MTTVIKWCLLACVAIIAVIGCASGRTAIPVSELSPQRRGALLLTATPPARERGCVVAVPPEGLPTVAQLVDSAALARTVGSESRFRGHYAIFTLAVDSTGAVKHLVTVESDASESAAERVRGLVSKHLVPNPDPSWDVRLRIDAGPPPRFEVGHQVLCRPLMRNRKKVARLAQWLVHRLPDEAFSDDYPLGRRRAAVRLVIGVEGHVLESKVVKRTGSSHFDRLVDVLVSAMRFRPATVDGVPIEVSAQIPLNFVGR